jgi:hypothetical protein
MMGEQTVISGKPFTLSDEAIQTQLLPLPARELQANTAIRAGKKSGCYSDTKAAAEACCDALENATDKFINYSVNGEWYCKYSDDGTGDWD